MDTGTIPDRIKRLQMLTSDALTRAHTLVTSVCTAAAAGGHDRKQGRGMMKVSRNIRKECNSVILIAFAAAMLAVCTSSALASATYIPPDPTNLTNATSRYWVNYSWTAGEPGNATDSYNVSINETWHNGTTNTSINKNVSSGVWVNITVWAWNASGTGTLSADCVSDDRQATAAFNSTFGLVGSIPTGGGGTYPPGWFETPTPTATATKAPAASVTATATTAPAAEMTAPAAEGTTAGTAKKGAPGFTAVFVIAGVLAVAYAMMRRRE